MAHKTTTKSLALTALSGGILLAISLSTLKLWEACRAAVGPSMAAYSVPALFFSFAVVAHFAGDVLPTQARRWTLACTYSVKLIASLALTLTTHAALICGQAAQTACADSPQIGEFSAALLALAKYHPPEVLVPMLVFLFFLVLGDALALALEFLHGSLHGQAGSGVCVAQTGKAA